MNKILLDIPETIETPRLRLAIPRAGMAEPLHAAILDGYEDCVRWINWPAMPPTIEAVEAENRKNHADFITRDFIRYIAYEKSSGLVVGRCAFPPPQTDWAIPQFGISYFIRKSQRGKGYAGEAARALTLLAFDKLKAQKVEIHCDQENLASNRVPEKIGFKLEYTKTGGWPRFDGKLAVLNVYSAFSAQDLIDT